MERSTLLGPYDLRAWLRPADVLLIVPPSAYLHMPLFGVHLLQALGRRVGVEVQVLYANLLFAAWFGESTHDFISEGLVRALGCERLFARSAYGGPALGRDGGAGLERELQSLRKAYAGTGRWDKMDLAAIRGLEAQIPEWLASIIEPAASAGYAAVGCSTCYEQNAASIALLKGIKGRSPRSVTIIGGANCEGEMADGLRLLTDAVDYIFSGDSEDTFAAFASGLRRGELPRDGIIRGAPCQDLESLPPPDYADYQVQLRAFLPGGLSRGQGWRILPYEAGRGCWWGEKSQCTFCGISGETMPSREKSADKILADLKVLVCPPPAPATEGGTPPGPASAGAPGKPLVYMVDRIIPLAYFREALPRIAEELPGAAFFWAFKASVSLQDVRTMKRSGMVEAQPGIEALSTGLLRLMAKGTRVAQNIAVMRYACAVGLPLLWSLLFGFPGDEVAFYAETLELLPLLRHLQPPWGVMPIRLHRFSPYTEHPERYGIRDLRPKAFYGEVLPECADVPRLAYYYDGDYQTIMDQQPELMARIKEEVRLWQRLHSRSPAPELRLERLGAGRFKLVDTRGLPGHPEIHLLDEEQAEVLLTSRSTHAVPRDPYALALAYHLVVERDNRYVPLAVADPDLLQEFEDRHRLEAVDRKRLRILPSDRARE